MFVKICANTNLHDALLAAELGADAIGFVFAPSKRQVTAAEVKIIASGLPSGIEKVGVFGDSDAATIASAVADAGLTAVQLHSEFDAELVRRLAASDETLKVIQTIAYPVDAEDRNAADARFAYLLQHALDEPAVWAVLIDAAKSGASGGLGIGFDWKHVAGIINRASAARKPGIRLILAGGLNPDNVAQAITDLRPWGVDVASGVEAVPGKKEPERLRAFLRGARGAEAR